MQELSMLDVYNKCLANGDSKEKAIDTIIDFWTNGLSASWSNEVWNKARNQVSKNLDKLMPIGA